MIVRLAPFFVCMLLFSACSVRKTSSSSSSDFLRNVEPLRSTPKSFGLLPSGTPGPGVCKADPGDPLRPSDSMGGWNPLDGSYILQVPVNSMLSFFYNTKNASYSLGKNMFGQSASPYIWQTNFDTEVVPNNDGSYTLRFPNRQSVKFINLGGPYLKAEDGSRDYMEVTADTITVYHPDEVGSFDVYKKVRYDIEWVVPGFGGARPPRCETSAGISSAVCYFGTFDRYLFNSTSFAADNSKPISVVRNSSGHVTDVYNVNGKPILKIGYKNAGGFPILPVSVWDAAEIQAIPTAPTTTLEWNAFGQLPILSKVNYQNDLGEMSALTINYVLNGRVPLLQSVSSSEPGGAFTTSFTLNQVAGPAAGSLTQIQTGTYSTKFVYNQFTSASGVTGYTVDVSRSVVNGGGTNTTEKLVLDPVNCKITEYINTTGVDTYFTRNGADPELVDIIGVTNDKVQSTIRYVRRGSGDVIQAKDIVGIDSWMAGSTEAHRDVSYDVDPTTGLTRSVIARTNQSYRTDYEYSDMSEFPKFGTRLLKVLPYQSGYAFNWTQYVYDQAQPYRLREVRMRDMPTLTLSYDQPSATGVPMRVTATYPMNPTTKPMASAFNEYGMLTSRDLLAGFKEVRTINPKFLRVDQISAPGGDTSLGYATSYPWRLESVTANSQQLSIERPDALSTVLKFRGDTSSSSSTPITATTKSITSGELQQSQEQGIIMLDIIRRDSTISP